ncbi:MAG: sigma-54 dependent transcriptional regulator [Desulfobacteraceae bacterium]|nr:sigma-54 dependent transcriptional regulator [Desulfobacteraceae bacterium]
MPDILIIDDDPGISQILAEVAKKMDCGAHCAPTAAQGLAAIQSVAFDLVLLDVGLPDDDGLHLLPQIRQIENPPEVIIITGNGDPDAAETAIRNGAWDYLVKPASVGDIKLTIQRALTYRAGKQAGLPKVLRRDGIVGQSTSLNAVLERVAQAAISEANVLICGETGTGKELMARAIHENSTRAQGPFVIVDCAALPETLVESLLFGHAKGAFTGADKERDGLIRQAHGGTLFLDEVGELPILIQKTFLRVIQEHRFRPVSGQCEVDSNFRLITATNRDLDATAAKGRFRGDLLFRLRSFSIDVPPLRRRKQDIQTLALFHINRLCGRHSMEIKGVSSDFLQALQAYQWPGNIRELFHALEEALAMAGHEPTLHPHHLPTHIRAILTRQSVKANAQNAKPPKASESIVPGPEGFMNFAGYRDLMERRYLEQLLRLTRGSRKEACRISGLSRTRLFELMKKHDLSEESVKPRPVAPLVRIV